MHCTDVKLRLSRVVIQEVEFRSEQQRVDRALVTALVQRLVLLLNKPVQSL
jgi:hypothetical protein